MHLVENTQALDGHEKDFGLIAKANEQILKTLSRKEPYIWYDLSKIS